MKNPSGRSHSTCEIIEVEEIMGSIPAVVKSHVRSHVRSPARTRCHCKCLSVELKVIYTAQGASIKPALSAFGRRIVISSKDTELCTDVVVCSDASGI